MSPAAGGTVKMTPPSLTRAAGHGGAGAAGTGQQLLRKIICSNHDPHPHSGALTSEKRQLRSHKKPYVSVYNRFLW